MDVSFWLVVLLVVLAATAPRYGADSRGAARIGEPDPPYRPRHTPAGDLAALRRLLARWLTGPAPTDRG
ncbi:MAG: hypothetical protein ACT4RN_06215 [Pseudonocardia sp.]